MPTPNEYHKLPEALSRLASEAKTETDRSASGNKELRSPY